MSSSEQRPKRPIRLDAYDLSQVSMIDDTSSSVWWSAYVWRIVLLSILLLALLLLPQTAYYHALGPNSWLFFVVAGGGPAVGFGLGRVLWLLMQESVKRAPQQVVIDKPDEPATPRQRFLLLASGSIGALLLGMNWLPWFMIDGSHSAGIFRALGVLVVGILLGRWLMLQAEASRIKAQQEPQRKPFEFPAYTKWITLSVLIALGVFAGFGESLFGMSSSEDRFLLGGVGFVMGLGGAIWLARRIEEYQHAHPPVMLDEKGRSSSSKITGKDSARPGL